MKLKRRIGRLLCKMDFHRWGPKYATASEVWGFLYGHHRQDCKRKGCNRVVNYRPS